MMMEKMMVLMMGSGDGGDDVDGDGGDDICFSFTKTTRWKAATRSTSGNGPNKEYTCDNETTKTHAFAKQRKCLMCRANEESTCGNETKTALAGTINEHTCGKESENVSVATEKLKEMHDCTCLSNRYEYIVSFVCLAYTYITSWHKRPYMSM